MSNVFVFRQPPPGFINEYNGGGGKGGTTTQSVSIPPEVLARYNAVNAKAESVAQQPFQQYGGEFVAGLNPTQQAGVAATTAASQSAQPYFGAATGLTLSGAQDVGPLTQGQIGYYQNPAMLATLAPTAAALQQQQGQQLSQQQAEAIKGGAFGGDRAGLQRQALRGQQQLGMGQALAPIYQQAYQTGLQTAQGQQGVVAQDLARRMQAGQQVAGLGTAAQQAGLQGAQAQMAAGQVGQQTQQAQDTAQYQQFLQERGYPFQVAQFLANIAMGTGALSGSTTTTQAPGGFFSDERLKHDVKEIGKTNDGQPIYSYKYNGDNRTQIGLMAQDVEKKHPSAIGLMGGYKTVDYKKATKDSERPHKDMGGGLMPDDMDFSSMGGAVMPDMSGEGFMRGGYVGGGLVGNDDWSSIIAANKAALGVYGGAQPMGGGSLGATGIVPQASMPTPKLVTAGSLPQQRPSGLSSAMQTGKDIAGIYQGGKDVATGLGKAKDWMTDLLKSEGGLIVNRHGYADGGMSEGEEAIPYDPSDVMGSKDPMEGVLKAGEHKIEPLKPAGGGGGGGGGSGLGDVASIMGTAAKIIPFFFKDGGLVPRHGYEFGGSPADYSPDADLPAQGAQEAGLVVNKPKYSDEELDKAAQAALALQMRRESGGDPRARAATSSAAGLYQITDPTAKGLIERNPNLGIKYDPGVKGFAATLPEEQQHALGLALSKEHVRTLANQGLEPSPQNVSANWFLGGAGGPALLKAIQSDPSMPATSVADPAAIRENQTMFFNRDGSPRSVSEVYSMLNKTGGSAPVPPMSIGDAVAKSQAAPSGGEGKKGLLDTVTSEGFVVPALGFLGSMLASNRPNLGGALGEGIMGGVGAYQSQQKLASEIAKRAAETGLEQAKIPETEMRTKAIQAGIYERRFIPDVGWQVIDKANNKVFYVTDANMNPIKGTGFEGNYQQIPVTGDSTVPKTSTAVVTPSGPRETDITKLVKPAQNVTEWTPTTSIPAQFQPRVHMATQQDEKQSEAALGEGTKLSESQTGKAEAASRQRMNLQQMMDDFNKLSDSAFLGTGSGAEARLNAAKALNTAYSAMTGGKTIFDPNNVAALEDIKKGSFRLGASLANSIGSREPGFIVAQSVQANPSIESSPTGFKIIASGLTQNALYEQDKKSFYDEYFSKFKHLKGASEAFDKVNPPEMYAKRAILNAVDPVVIDDIKRYKASDMQPIIDKKYGRGTYKILTGG
jgi:hypothetical protein